MLRGVDTADNQATRKALRRQAGTVLALRDEHAESTELFRLTHLSLNPLVTDRFMEAWVSIDLDYGEMRELDGPYFLQIVTYHTSYRWV